MLYNQLPYSPLFDLLLNLWEEPQLLFVMGVSYIIHLNENCLGMEWQGSIFTTLSIIFSLQRLLNLGTLTNVLNSIFGNETYSRSKSLHL